MKMPEAVIGGLLVVGSILIFATNFYRFVETDLFAVILLIQSLPFLSAVALVVAGTRERQQNEKNDCCSGSNLRKPGPLCSNRLHSDPV